MTDSSRTSRVIVCWRSCLLGLCLALQVANFPLLGSQFGRKEQYFAHVVLNQGSTTSFSIYNPSSTEPILVNVELNLANGDFLIEEVQLEPGQTGSVSFGEPDQTLTRGSAKLTSEGEFIATAFIQLFMSGQLKPRIGLLPSVVAPEVRVFGFVTDQFRSGIALHNPGDAPTEVTLSLTGEAGQQALKVFETKTFILDPQQSLVAFLNEETFFGTALTNYEGTVEVSASPFPVAVCSLTQEESGDLAAVSVETPLGEHGDPAGSQGPQGPEGSQGDQGSAGPQGPQGDQGLVGPQGSQGIQGIAGLEGSTGAQGPKGDKGEKGDTGPKGVLGFYTKSGVVTSDGSGKELTLEVLCDPGDPVVGGGIKHDGITKQSDILNITNEPNASGTGWIGLVSRAKKLEEGSILTVTVRCAELTP